MSGPRVRGTRPEANEKRRRSEVRTPFTAHRRSIHKHHRRWCAAVTMTTTSSKRLLDTAVVRHAMSDLRVRYLEAHARRGQPRSRWRMVPRVGRPVRNVTAMTPDSGVRTASSKRRSWRTEARMRCPVPRRPITRGSTPVTLPGSAVPRARDCKQRIAHATPTSRRGPGGGIRRTRGVLRAGRVGRCQEVSYRAGAVGERRRRFGRPRARRHR
jgi:hypothetical protein